MLCPVVFNRMVLQGFGHIPSRCPCFLFAVTPALLLASRRRYSVLEFGLLAPPPRFSPVLAWASTVGVADRQWWREERHRLETSRADARTVHSRLETLEFELRTTRQALERVSAGSPAAPPESPCVSVTGSVYLSTPVPIKGRGWSPPWPVFSGYTFHI